MATTPPAMPRTIAGVRIATSVFFLLFGEYKLASPGFAHGGFQGYLHDYITSTAVGFYRPVLSALVLPHAVFFVYSVGFFDLLFGLSLQRVSEVFHQGIVQCGERRKGFATIRIDKFGAVQRS